ncbi:uncharacterized protein LOC131675286 [Phymastichus coffea]|uniref:uncharacterized protein LOC131675286 n=1 Tax=Phymastichus coffea TaxID=108790 RepID=UPI00273B993F|nr:uncharacterized protein LOC131675286 [Phymastichus coffea]
MSGYLNFSVVVIVLITIASVSADVPSYIEVCGRRNPKLNECVEESVRKLRPKLRAGIPELEVPSIEPLNVSKIVLSDRKDFRAVATQVSLSGLSEFRIQSTNLDLEQHRIDFQVLFERVSMKANYDVKAKIVVPIAERGPLDVVTGKIEAKVMLRFKIVERGTRRFMYFPSMTTSLDIADYTVISVENAKDKPFSQAVNSVLTSSRRDIIGQLTPYLEKSISTTVLEVANRICKHFTFDELFPDRP